MSILSLKKGLLHLTPTAEAWPTPPNSLFSEVNLQAIQAMFIGPTHRAVIATPYFTAMLHAGTSIFPFTPSCLVTNSILLQASHLTSPSRNLNRPWPTSNANPS